MDIDALHQKILYPTTRVRFGKVGGSGVLVYSEPDSKHPGAFINVALTCEHVIEDAIKIVEAWDGVLKQQCKTEVLDEVAVEIFDYDGSTVLSSNATLADIVAYDKKHDLAALRLHNTRRQPHISTILPKADIPALRLFEPVWACGCSLSHDPFACSGTMTYLREMIDQKTYVMSSAACVFGVSGGGLFRGSNGDLLGLVSRITTIPMGFGGVDILTQMGFSTHPVRIHEFIGEQELQFLVDPTDNYYAAQERREKRRKDAVKSILLGEKSGGEVRGVPSTPRN